MPIHDAYARRTPYELLLVGQDFFDRGFADLEAEAGARGVDPENPAAFAMLGPVQGMVGELTPSGADATSVHDAASVLYFAYHMWRTGPRVVLVRDATLRGWIADQEAAEASGPARAEVGSLDTLAGSAGYVQLPSHCLWVGGGDGPGPAAGDAGQGESPGGQDRPPDAATGEAAQAPRGSHESVDGFFWAAGGGGVLHLALITGMWRDRPGYTVVPVPPHHLAEMYRWTKGPVRDGGGDYSTTLPGAGLDGLLEVRTPAEVYKIAALALGSLKHARDPELTPSVDASGAAPRPTELPFVVL